MADSHVLDPVHGDDVPMVEDAVAVGEDLEFQERWWTFERFIWGFFVLVLIADVLGVFGNGWLAKAEIKQPGAGMLVKYERVERTGSPSKLTVQFGPDAVANGKVLLFTSDSIVKNLGAQRIIPQPETSAVTKDGLLYTFPAGRQPGEVSFELQPASPGIHWFQLQVPGKQTVSARVVVLP